MDAGQPMLAAQSEVLFTYPTRTGDYDKIGRPLMQECVHDSVRVRACVTVCGVCVRVCVVKSWRPGLRSICVCV